MTTDVTPLPGQYTVSRRAGGEPPEGFEQANVGEWTVVYDAGFTETPVVAGDDAVGVVIGKPLDVERGGRPDDVRLAGDGPPVVSSAIDRIQSRLVGRYVGLIEATVGPRLFTDPIGALPAVYYEAGGFAAASPLSVPTVSHASHFRGELFEAVSSPGSSWLPGTTTYYRGIRRLLPNHSLDLESWESERYWPARRPDPDTTPGDDVVGAIATELAAVFESAMDHYRGPMMGLTAGKDSRCLLAVARRWATDGALPLYTYASEEHRRDVHVARRIAGDLDLDWVPVSVTEATRRQRERFLRRTGHAVSTAVKAIFPTIRGLDTDARIEGLGGEIGRGYYWRISDDERTALDAEGLLERFDRPPRPVLVDDLDDWLGGMEAFDTLTTLDLAYQEHRLGSWGGPQQLGVLEDGDYIAPFCYRPVIQLLHQTSPDLRRFDLLPERIVDRAWRELKGYPYNAYPGLGRWRNLRDRLRLARAGVANPRGALRYATFKYVRQ